MGAPWKFPLLRTVPSGKTIGLSIALANSRSATLSACMTVSRAPPATCGAHRSE